MLRKQNRRQPPAAFYRGFVSRAPCIEKLDKLLAGAVVIPFAIALDDADQLVERFHALALAVEREREIEARLMVERIGGDFLLQLGNRSERLGLLCKLKRRTRRCDRP